MEGIYNSPQNNDELIDNLVNRRFIRSRNVERVFRALDRADYMTPEMRDLAYEDLDWRNGPLHLLAPCKYSVVMEALVLKPGQSFLNIGSGTGYLSTLAGLILGTAGINHGVEVHPTVLEHALEKIQWFLDTSPVLHEIDFCEPKFYLGNGLCLSQPLTGYDRVYYDGSCPREYHDYLRRLIKVGGILVMPFNNTVVQVRRVAENQWVSRCAFDVYFAPLRVPNAEDESNPVKLDTQTPVRLELLARAAIRAAMYRGVMRRNPMLAERPPAPAARCSCSVPLVPGDSDEDLDPVQIAWRLLDCNTHGANLRDAILRLADHVTPPEDDDQEERAGRPDDRPRGHDRYYIRELAHQFMARVATDTDPGDRSGDTSNTAMDTDADTALPAETTPAEAADAAISQDPNSVPPRPDLPGMPSEVEIDLGKMAQTEATASPSEMVWEETRPDSVEGSEDETDANKSEPKRQNLDSGIGESTPGCSSADKSQNSESDRCVSCGRPTAEPEDTFDGRGFDRRRRLAARMAAALSELPLPRLLKIFLNFGRGDDF